ncbi:hypothetical protein TGPRC2_214930 [Toxoplasma gondii TgCatPRC2]|uniref:ATPTG10-like domain-containing protein n=15 Tax=Toxoplasma gondii TaxID=5811 RepID=B9PZM9_TOXGV|nr:hypothetical protein TGME49_214930 [Toxoplasma gondii ME49]6TMG_P Chain P, ATPTG10 [Toxoplasma gondii GT1]6TMG_p Chain p, ATPTG10 [Toxoplasma gondii GT1]6TMK_P Chain P, ATPTG10 [Toxoplasma gondii GT1]6TMK_p Chain p, ATPTG10 [Toxoplasma gondii GT1]6TML_P7 Chain P7, ATPTG10 [Toxoplasma gondii GT1]6TML_P8 Chain P8, ATPTG10 [Toxoplasma gondii GT1]6TML_P9 Chain P9, ATPTG10 [Toxoplasma gondii GT1]6TML_p7 Chain p7, ATPTG10 [Toxoplasma gondii GT1]6TML_p8 Chain p8, ATPTG10 [Toxoplasma gondii GT1|eukprot:XP_002370814.1 hypothetical protein TGME49_214930 [Toxoplasma gondii ME49]
MSPPTASASVASSGSSPHMDRLLGDLKLLAAYDSAAGWQEPKAMESAFQSLSWDDADVLKALPQYLNCRGEQKRRVDFAYAALCPRPVDEKDPKQTLMSLWMKARLFSYDQKHPFVLSPFAATDKSTSAGAMTAEKPF